MRSRRRDGTIVRSPRIRSAVPWLALAAVAALPGDGARGLLAALAGTLFEAAPFLAIAAVLPRRIGRLAGLAGCGCGGPGVPGALAPVAIGLCWVTFGPAVALGRALVALAVAFACRKLGRRQPSHDREPGDPFAELAAIGGCAAAAYALFELCPWATGSAPGALAFGLAVGALAPCATAGVALASASTAHAPLAAAAILGTSGIVPHLRLPRATPRSAACRRPAAGGGRFATLALAVALAVIARSGPSGLVNPRLLPLDAVGALAAVLLTFRGTECGHPARALALAAAMLAALALGSPQPRVTAAETTLADGYAGEPARFTGVAYADREGAGTRLVRFAITCCRIDARAIALPLDRRIGVPDGTWIAATGTLGTNDGTLVLRASAWHAIAAPRDPFVYR
jgi:hypothetical protein